MKIIAAINRLGYIGKDGKLPWDVPEDLQLFKAMTSNCNVIMGYNTFKSLNYKPLHNRRNFVVASEFHHTDQEDVFFQKSLLEAHYVSDMMNTVEETILSESMDYKKPDTFVIGGAQLYEEALDHVDEVLLTVINDYTTGDVSFPITKLIDQFEKYQEMDFKTQHSDMTLIKFRRK